MNNWFNKTFISVVTLMALLRTALLVLFCLATVSPGRASEGERLSALVYQEEPLMLAAFDARKALFDTLRAAGKSYDDIAGQLYEKFSMGAISIARLMNTAHVSRKRILRALKSALSASADTAVYIARNVFDMTNSRQIAVLLNNTGYSLGETTKALNTRLRVGANTLASILGNTLHKSDQEVALALNDVLHSYTSVIRAIKGGLNAGVSRSAEVLHSAFGYGKSKASDLAVILKDAGYTAQADINRIARFMKDVLDMTRDAARAALMVAYAVGVRIEDALVFAYGAVSSAVVAIANAVSGGYFVGRASNCNANAVARNRAYRGKFNAFEPVPTYQDVNHYLAMQAALMTYPKNFRYGNRRPQNEHEYRCAAQAKYREWGFNDVVFANSVQGGNAIVASKSDMVLIAIRGTEDPIGSHGEKGEHYQGIVDSLTNVGNLGMMIPYVLPTMRGLNVGRMHAGYASLVSNFIPVLVDALKRTEIRPNGRKRIYVTGHSLGGASAILVGYSLKLLKFNIDATYAYAPPKVGDKLLNDSIHKTVPLYVTRNYRDPVPTIPYLIDIRRQFVPAMDAARTSVYFSRVHTARAYSDSFDHRQRERQIQTDQGVAQGLSGALDRPLLLLQGGNILSKEWKYHSGNYYLAYAYKKLSDAGGIALRPEFSTADSMCVNTSGSSAPRDTNAIRQSLLVNEVYAAQANQCSSDVQKVINVVGGVRTIVRNSVSFVQSGTKRNVAGSGTDRRRPTQRQSESQSTSAKPSLVQKPPVAQRTPMRPSPASRRLRTVTSGFGPDIEVRLTTQKTARLGSSLNYRVSVINRDAKRRSGMLVLKARLPSTMTYIRNPRDGWTAGRGVVWRNIRSLAAAHRQSFNLRIKTLRPGRASTRVSVHAASRSPRDPNMRNNTRSISTLVK